VARGCGSRLNNIKKGGVGDVNRIFEWIKASWNDESNVGKAKLAAVAALLFLVIASLLPDPEPGIEVPDRGAVVREDVDGDAARQAAQTYDSYEARIGELERESRSAEEQAAAAYHGYEARVAELEQERLQLQARLDEYEPGATAATEAADAYRSYEVRIGELEQEKRILAEQMAKLEAGGDAAREAAAAYASYAARVAELEEAMASGAREAAETYDNYTARIGELERANAALQAENATLRAALERFQGQETATPEDGETTP